MSLVIGYVAAYCDLSGGPRSENQYSYSEEHNGDARAWAPTPYGKATKPGEYTADCNNPKGREEADLCQQWRAAKAAEKAAAIAEAQAYWNWVQLAGILATVAAAWAAVIAARAAQSSVNVAEKTAKRQLRAYPVVNGGHVIVVTLREGGSGISVHVSIKNTGTTPAYFFRTSLLMVAVGTPEEIPFVKPPVFGGATILGPGETAHMNRTIEFDIGQLQDLRDRNRIVYIWGLASFRDAFNKDRYVYFRIINGAENFDRPNAWSIGAHDLGYDTSEDEPA